MSQERFEPEFVELMPRTLEPGKLYISVEYRVTKHLCASGCGEQVVLPLHPAQWQFAYDGENVSLHPSVGNVGLACRSHYWIRGSRVHWAASLSEADVRRGQARDMAALQQVEEPTPSDPHLSWWRRLLGRRG